jgi:hypothetical protein
MQKHLITCSPIKKKERGLPLAQLEHIETIEKRLWNIAGKLHLRQ